MCGFQLDCVPGKLNVCFVCVKGLSTVYFNAATINNGLGNVGSFKNYLFEANNYNHWCAKV